MLPPLRPFSPTSIFFPPAWFQILNYNCFSPTAHISLIHYCGGGKKNGINCKQAVRSNPSLSFSRSGRTSECWKFRGWNNGGGQPAVWLKGPKKCLELGVFTSIFCSFGGKERKELRNGEKISRGGCKRKGEGRTYTGGKLTSSERAGGIDLEKQSLMLKTGGIERRCRAGEKSELVRR